MSQPGFDILFEDDALLVVVKPAGIATQAPPDIESLESRIKRYLAPDAGSTVDVYLGIPHRLDRPVSGVMVFAKTHRVARNLARQFERRRVRKQYWACVQGTVEPAAGTWTDYLCKVYGKPKTMVVECTHAGAQYAVLHYRAIGRHSQGSWLEIELETGRTHQVRVQAATRGYPVLGDTHYGCELPFGPHYEDERLRPIALHARSLTVMHTLTREEMTFESPVGDAWQELELERSP
ncbi:MAG: RluA family pseudouridine synthase [Pirellulales bacterium]